MLLQAQQPDHSEGLSSAYRAYEIGSDGRIRTSIEVFASSDDDAREQARVLAIAGTWELWDRGRMVERFEPEGR